MKKGKVTKENQELFFTSIRVKKEQMGLFLKGQSNLVNEGNTYVMTTNPGNPVRFKADLQTLVEGANGLLYGCTVEVGSIEFDLQESIPETDGDEVVFENVPAMIYPNGVYRAVLPRDE